MSETTVKEDVTRIPDSKGLYLDKKGDLWGVSKELIALQLTDEEGFCEFYYDDSCYTFDSRNDSPILEYTDFLDLTSSRDACQAAELYAPFTRVTGFVTE